MRKIFEKYEVLRFMVVGGGAALVHYLLYIGLLRVGVPYNFAYIVSFMANLLCNFFGSNLITFHTRPTLMRGVKFAISNAVNFFVHILLFNVAIWIGFSEKLAPVFAYTFTFPINFVLVRFALKGFGAKLDSVSDSD
ncbi:MAG: GtrA family protein [Rikenellaceae bacterium]